METNARLKEKKKKKTHTQSNKPQKPNEQLLNEKKKLTNILISIKCFKNIYIYILSIFNNLFKTNNNCNILRFIAIKVI